MLEYTGMKVAEITENRRQVRKIIAMWLHL